MKSVGDKYQEQLTHKISYIGFESCLDDPNVWMCKAVKPDDFKY